MEKSVQIRAKIKVIANIILKDVILTLATFCTIFMFKIYSFIDSAMLVAFYLAISVIFNARYRSYLMDIIRNTKFKNICFIFLAMNVWCLFSIIINGTNDFSFLKTFLHLFIQIITCILFYSYLKYRDVSNKIIYYIIISFIIQALIIVAGILIPSINQFLLLTKNDLQVTLSNHYGYRGVSLSGSSFFGLAISFGIVFIIVFYYFLKEKKFNFYTLFMCLSLLTFASLSAGRISILGLFFGILYFFIVYKALYKKNGHFLFGLIFYILSIGVIILVVLLAFSEKTMHLLGDFQFYITEFFTNSSGGIFKTTSTSKLFEKMFFYVDLKTFFIGDGLYTVNDGLYYMNTDSGIMRPVLYAGFPCLVMLVILQYNFITIGLKKPYSKNNLIIVILLMIMITIFQIKGEVFGYALIFNSIVVLFGLSLYERENTSK